MAIDDNTNYTLTGEQVKDLAARIKAGGGMTVYVDASFSTPELITGVFSDKTLTTPADSGVMADTILTGGTVVVIFDGGQSLEIIELSSVRSNSRFPEIGKTFTSTISTSVVFSAPTVVTLLHDDYSDSWSVETTAVSAVNDATLTIQHNGTDVQTFTANQSTNATANIETIWADDIAPATEVPPITSNMIDWSTMGTSVALTSLGSPDRLTNISNHSYVVGGKFLIVNFIAYLTTSGSSYTQAGEFTLPSNIGYEAPISASIEGGTFRYAYLESNGTFVVATSAAVSNLKIRVNGVVVLS